MSLDEAAAGVVRQPGRRRVGDGRSASPIRTTNTSIVTFVFSTWWVRTAWRSAASASGSNANSFANAVLIIEGLQVLLRWGSLPVLPRSPRPAITATSCAYAVCVPSARMPSSTSVQSPPGPNKPDPGKPISRGRPSHCLHPLQHAQKAAYDPSEPSTDPISAPPGPCRRQPTAPKPLFLNEFRFPGPSCNSPCKNPRGSTWRGSSAKVNCGIHPGEPDAHIQQPVATNTGRGGRAWRADPRCDLMSLEKPMAWSGDPGAAQRWLRGGRGGYQAP
jgi:hypothetical protein